MQAVVSAVKLVVKLVHGTVVISFIPTERLDPGSE